MLAKKLDAGIYYGRNTAKINFGIHIYRQLFVDVGVLVPNHPDKKRSIRQIKIICVPFLE
jgi:hypothetical protein